MSEVTFKENIINKINERIEKLTTQVSTFNPLMFEHDIRIDQELAVYEIRMLTKLIGDICCNRVSDAELTLMINKGNLRAVDRLPVNTVLKQRYNELLESKIVSRAKAGETIEVSVMDFNRMSPSKRVYAGIRDTDKWFLDLKKDIADNKMVVERKRRMSETTMPEVTVKPEDIIGHVLDAKLVGGELIIVVRLANDYINTLDNFVLTFLSSNKSVKVGDITINTDFDKIYYFKQM